VRKIAATYIFPGNSEPIKNGILVCEDDGTILEIIEKGDDFHEEAGVEYYSGVLVPGFVNAHCHLELSHLKNKVEEKTGIGGFIGQINRLRKASEDEMLKAAKLADRKMWAAGISAVGDISNTILSIPVKLKSAIHYYTFVETFGFHPSRAERAFELATSVKKSLDKANLPGSIVPHSPYSVSKPLFRRIEKEAKNTSGILSIHNQESKGETQFYLDGTGPIAEHLQNNLGLDIAHWTPPGKSSLESILEYLPTENQLLLVHNTFTGENDLEGLNKKRSIENTFMVLCSNSNLYIEDAFPPVQLFSKYRMNICLGTDSLASNHGLSILQEMITLQKHFAEITLQQLVEWACVNGAKALGFDHQIGSFDTGKKPGVNLITGLDLKELKLTEKAKVKRLI